MTAGRFLVAGAAMPPAALAVDGALPGAIATYSHWRGAPPVPPGLSADSSTAILANAARDPQRWLSGFAWACNDHVDADGLLAVAIACRPALADAHRDLLIGAAEAGDFSAWPGEDAFRLMLALHQRIRDERARGGDWEARLHDGIAAALPGLVAESARRDPERDAAVAQVLDARDRLRRRDGFAVEVGGGLATVAWRERLGSAGDGFLAVHRPEDLPAWAMDAVAGPADFQLLAMAGATGTTYRLDAPRHSWAVTVARPTVPWPELGPLAARLQALEGEGCRWLARPASAQLGFVCLLGSGDRDGAPAPSRLPLDVVRAACAEALAAAPRPAPWRP